MADAYLSTLVDLDVAAGKINTDKLVETLQEAVSKAVAAGHTLTPEFEILPNIKLKDFELQLKRALAPLLGREFEGEMKAKVAKAAQPVLELGRAIQVVSKSVGQSSFADFSKAIDQTFGTTVGKAKAEIRGLSKEITGLKKEIRDGGKGR